MKTLTFTLFLLLSMNTWAEAADAGARQVLDDFLDAFNARDEAAWADSLHFPHVRLASQTVTVYQDRDEFIDAMDMDAFARNLGWSRSTWDEVQAVQKGDDKVHFAVQFSRYNIAGEVFQTFDSLYIVERIDGRWGVRARSSFAP